MYSARELLKAVNYQFLTLIVHGFPFSRAFINDEID